jgi:hypothetical protein
VGCDYDDGLHPASGRIRAVSAMASAYVCRAGRRRIARSGGYLAIRKDHGEPPSGAKRGDLFQIILIQVKGGFAAKPTVDHGTRLRIVAKKHGACRVLLATWKKGKAARFFSLRPKANNAGDWIEVADLEKVFQSQGL